MGPGLKGVSPALIAMSSGAMSPAFAGAALLVASSARNSLKGFMLVVITAHCPSTDAFRASSPGLTLAASVNAMSNIVFLVMMTLAEPRSPCLIC
jgi:hypothetical protein